MKSIFSPSVYIPDVYP